MVFYQVKGESKLLRSAVENHMGLIMGAIKKPVVDASQRQSHLVDINEGNQSYEIDG